ncbi:Zinc finger MYND domain-containing protein 10 [Mycena venus]|uniref:Zinc finger MYND domain-containing protein 10 n=1 Tax=Mycena venus TaxID=2733690 RepID=A0A8H7CW51_9AGAR|nr:Zinc finger MYND domain-containing protein 10 [Mycena venus]
MSHIQYFRLTPAVAEKEQKDDKGPSPNEIRANARIQVYVCSACGENPGSEPLKNCAGCRVALYCSKKCQVSNWPTHKQSCGGTASSDINLKLAKKLVANDELMFYLKVYSVLALDLLTAPETALDTCLVVKLTTKDADPLATVRAMINQEERGPGASIMLQIASIERKPIQSRTTPAMRASLDIAISALAGTEFSSWPVVMLVFTGDGTNCLGLPSPIDPEALKQGRERNPFVIQSAILGKRDVPVNEENIIEMFNNKIYMDKQNRYLLHTKSKN